jgi:hypothetical protein
MKEVLIELLQGYLYRTIILITIAAGAIFVSMVIDLFFGIKKAKERDEATTSKALRRTCSKAMKYFAPFIILALLDIMGAVWLPSPVFSLLWTVYCVSCEFISVREKAWTKAELAKADKTMRVIVENKEDIAHLVSKIVAAQLEQQQQSETSKTDES